MRPSRQMPHRTAVRSLLLGWVLLLCVAAVGQSPAYAQTGPSTLVLYDAPQGKPYQKLGRAYAIMLANLLGHWDARVALVPVDQYVAGSIDAHQATFYLGSHYDNPLPEALLRDVDRSTRPVVWFKYNFWQMNRIQGFDATTRFGFRFLGNRGLQGDPAATAPDFFDTVVYRAQRLRKYYAWDAASLRVFADPDIGLTEVVDAAKAQLIAPIANTALGTEAPYVLRSGNFWYVADMPFSYIGPRDRYLVIADLLHDMLGLGSPPAGSTRSALVRLEDVSALTEPAHLRTLTDLMRNWRDPVSGAATPLPFSIALIPRYRDPLGVYNGGVAQDVRLRNATGLRSALDEALARGGRLVMHGYTHQTSNVRNPWTAVSGDDFEFWDIVRNQPLPKDALRDWRSVFDSGVKELSSAGYTAFAFETPHYQASPNAYRVSAEKFGTVYERAVYYTSDAPKLNVDTADRDFAVGQFFPYPIRRDWYGRKVLPENLGNIEYDIREIDPSSSIRYTWQDIALNARILNAVVRDGVASFFFHPFWLETLARPDGTSYGYDALADLRQLLDSIAGLGFRFIDPKGL